MSDIALEFPNESKHARRKRSQWLRGRRKYVYELLHASNPSEKEPPAHHYVRVVIATLIGLSMLAVILESEPELEKSYRGYFYAFEIVIIAAFSLEYVLRLWSIVEEERYSHWLFGRLRYIVTPMALVDLVSVLPFYLQAFVTLDLRYMRTLRLVRLVRVMKLGHYSTSLTMINRVIKNKKHEMVASIFLVGVLLIVASTIMYHVENEAQPEKFSSIPTTMWWGVATLTTVGYGDLVPKTLLGRIFSSVISILGIGVFALPAGILVSGFIEDHQEHHPHQHKHETLICSNCKAEMGTRERT